MKKGLLDVQEAQGKRYDRAKKKDDVNIAFQDEDMGVMPERCISKSRTNCR